MSSQMAQLQEATIKAQCKTLRMPMMASQFGTLAEQAIREKKSHIGYLEALLLAEIEERERNTIERRIREAHLPRLKTLEEFDYTQSPNVTAAKMRTTHLCSFTARAQTVPHCLLPLVTPCTCKYGQTTEYFSFQIYECWHYILLFPTNSFTSSSRP